MRAWLVARAGLVTAVALGLGAAGHVIGGGTPPAVPLLAAVGATVLALSVLVGKVSARGTGRVPGVLGALGTAGTLVVGQLAVHVLAGWAPTGHHVTSVAGHHPVLPPGGAPLPVAHLDAPGVPMLAGHLAAAALAALLVAVVDRCAILAVALLHAAVLLLSTPAPRTAARPAPAWPRSVGPTLDVTAALPRTRAPPLALAC